MAVSGVGAVYVVKWNETAVLGGSVLLSCETPLGSYKVGKNITYMGTKKTRIPEGGVSDFSMCC